jgi:hypothetical protein
MPVLCIPSILSNSGDLREDSPLFRGYCKTRNCLIFRRFLSPPSPPSLNAVSDAPCPVIKSEAWIHYGDCMQPLRSQATKLRMPVSKGTCGS